MWLAMWADIVRDPFSGRGQDAYLPYMLNPWEEGSHNFPLEVLHAAGLIGFASYAVFHAAIFARGGRTAVRTRHYPDMGWSVVALIAGGAAIVVASLTNLIFWNPIYWTTLGMLAGATTVATNYRASHPVARRVRSLRHLQATTA